LHPLGVGCAAAGAAQAARAARAFESGGGLLLATSPRVDWARLLRRTFDVAA